MDDIREGVSLQIGLDLTESIVSASINLYRELQMNLGAITWG